MAKLLLFIYIRFFIKDKKARNLLYKINIKGYRFFCLQCSMYFLQNGKLSETIISAIDRINNGK
jgi:hypothetical protein